LEQRNFNKGPIDEWLRSFVVTVDP
jgi:hypothetical protein